MGKNIIDIFSLCKRYLLNNKIRMTIYFLISLFAGTIPILLPYITGNFLDVIVNKPTINNIISYCFVFAIIGLSRIMIGFFMSKLYVKLQSEMGISFNTDVINHIQDISLKFIDNNNKAFLTQNINMDSNNLIIFCLNFFQDIIINIVSMVIVLIILVNLNLALAIIISICLLLYIIVYQLLKKNIYQINKNFSESQSNFFSKLLEQLDYIEFIKIHAVKTDFRKRLNSTSKNLIDNAKSSQNFNFVFSSLSSIVGIITTIFIYFFGGLQVINNNFTIGMFTIFISYSGMLMNSSNFLFNLSKSIQETMVSHDRLKNILSEKIEKYGNKKTESIEKIEVKNLKFNYNTNGDTLKYNNMTFEKGNIYGIWGENGSGKTTVIKLILGLYKNERKGEVLYNGLSIDNLDIDFILKNMISVSNQNTLLINDSIKYNILLEDEFFDNNRKDFLKSLINVLDFNNFINNFDEDLLKNINEQNDNVSGGEKQKITLLRTLFKESNVVILDEPTSALDKKSSYNLLEYLNTIKKNKIIVLISHDIKVKKYCDIIYKIKN